MSRHDNFHSRFVAWMKIILPLTALGLLSTLFLISRTVDPSRSIPVAEVDLEQRARDQGVTNPTISGVTSGGDEIMLKARAARPDPADATRLHAEDVTATIRLESGGGLDIVADRADLRQGDDIARLEGHVVVTTTTGYRLETDTLIGRTDIVYAQTPGPVQGTGPPGELTAGRMILSTDSATGAAQLHFTDGVKLIYRPRISEE